MRLNITNEELDVICLALVEAQDFRRAKEDNLKNNQQVANLYEAIRRSLREQFPNTASLEKLLEEMEVLT